MVYTSVMSSVSGNLLRTRTLMLMMGFKGFPDPFAVATIGGEQTQTTSVIKKTLNPYWNESFDMYGAVTLGKVSCANKYSGERQKKVYWLFRSSTRKSLKRRIKGFWVSSMCELEQSWIWRMAQRVYSPNMV